MLIIAGLTIGGAVVGTVLGVAFFRRCYVCEHREIYHTVSASGRLYECECYGCTCTRIPR